MRVQFPILGLAEGVATVEQKLLTSFSLQNCRPYDVTDSRLRGGQRPGTVLAYTTQIAGDFPIISMVEITTTYITPE